MGDPVSEDVNAMLIRSIRWTSIRPRCDGFRLDAVKHVPSYFFGQQSGANKDPSSAGFLGRTQAQFNLTHGYTDWSNHRNTAFALARRAMTPCFSANISARRRIRTITSPRACGSRTMTS